MWISQRLYHTISTCSVKCKLKSIFSTKGLPASLPSEGKPEMKHEKQTQRVIGLQIWSMQEVRNCDIFTLLHFLHSSPLYSSPHFLPLLLSGKVNVSRLELCSSLFVSTKSWDIVFLFLPIIHVFIPTANQSLLTRWQLCANLSFQFEKERLKCLAIDLIIYCAIFSHIDPDSPAFRKCFYQVQGFKMWDFWKSGFPREITNRM